jgi:hypothetical protein
MSFRVKLCHELTSETHRVPDIAVTQIFTSKQDVQTRVKSPLTMKLLLPILSSALLMCLSAAHLGRPLRGSVPLSVLLCNFKDSKAPIDNKAYYENLFINTGTGGLADYWNKVSYGAINVQGSTVRGWYTIDKTIAQAKTASRDGKMSDCYNAAIAGGYTPPADQVVIFVTDPGIDAFGQRGKVFLGAPLNLGLVAHEAGHGIGMRHSFTIDTDYCNIGWALKGEYGDPWCVMSHAASFNFDAGVFRRGGPGLNAYQVDRNGSF